MKRICLLPLVITVIGIQLLLQLSSSADAKRPVTFTQDVAPILFGKCVTCHRPGEAAPMSLLSYQDARPWARSIREKVITS